MDQLLLLMLQEDKQKLLLHQPLSVLEPVHHWQELTEQLLMAMASMSMHLQELLVIMQLSLPQEMLVSVLLHQVLRLMSQELDDLARP
jgi:hypothetical protein